MPPGRSNSLQGAACFTTVSGSPDCAVVIYVNTGENGEMVCEALEKVDYGDPNLLLRGPQHQNHVVSNLEQQIIAQSSDGDDDPLAALLYRGAKGKRWNSSATQDHGPENLPPPL